MLLGTCSCAAVRCVLCALSGFAAPGGRCCLAPVRVPWLWPAACLSGVPRGPAWCAAPRPVRSLSVLRSAFPTPWCLSPARGHAPPALLGGCAGHAEAGRKPGSLCLPLAPAEAGALGPLRVVPVRGPAIGLSLAGPSGVGLGLRALRWLACVDPVTDASGFLYRPSFDGGLGRCSGAVLCGRRHLSSAVRRTPRPGPVCVCVCLLFLAGSGEPASRARSGAPHLFLWPLCLSALLGSLRAWVAPLLVVCFCFVFFSSFSVVFFLAPPLSIAFIGFRPRVPWALALRGVCPVGLTLLGSPCALAFLVLPGHWPLSGGCPPPPLSRCCCRSSLPCAFFLLFPPLHAPLVSGFLFFPDPGAHGLGAALCLLCSALRALCFFFAPRLSVLRALSPVLCLPVGWWLFPGGCCPPPRFCVSRFSSFALGALRFFPSLLVRPRCLRLSLVSGPGCPRPWRCVMFFFLGLPLPRSPCALAALWWLLSPPPFPFCVSRLSLLLLGTLVFFFSSSSVRPRCLRLSVVPGPGCPGPRRCALFALLAFRFSALRAPSPLSCFPPGRWLLPGGCCPPLPPLCLAVFVAAAWCCVPCSVLCCVSLGAVLRLPAARCAARCYAAVCCVALQY